MSLSERVKSEDHWLKEIYLCGSSWSRECQLNSQRNRYKLKGIDSEYERDQILEIQSVEENAVQIQSQWFFNKLKRERHWKMKWGENTRTQIDVKKGNRTETTSQVIEIELKNKTWYLHFQAFSLVPMAFTTKNSSLIFSHLYSSKMSSIEQGLLSIQQQLSSNEEQINLTIQSINSVEQNLLDSRLSVRRKV